MSDNHLINHVSLSPNKLRKHTHKHQNNGQEQSQSDPSTPALPILLDHLLLGLHLMICLMVVVLLE